ncbi:LPD38 domain-containing protein [Paenibacillus bouchesdurhonensis]|uniref:LPD38 domain-containing protein n=1 Tax=Paenibacillus bouchesdurhonensis TaxID=1870990 RepID=UPI000DA5EEAB|nr:LPD38 domain-containing protein [Paenibacillus bouchesdurhonensis]
MSSFDDVRDRIKRGQGAKERVLQRLSMPEASTSIERETSTFDAIRNRPIDTKPTSGTPMAELQSKYGAFTPMNLVNAAMYDAAMKNQQAAKAQSGAKPLTEYEKNKEYYDTLSPYNPAKYFASAMNWITRGNPVGNFASRIGHQADSVMSGGNPATIQPQTGSRAADITADIAGSVASVFTPTGAPVNMGPIAGTYAATDKVLLSPLGMKAEQAAANQLSKLIKPQTAQALTREGLREGVAGAMQGAAFGAMTGKDDAGILAEAALGGGIGGALGMGFRAAGMGLSKLFKKNGIPDSEIAEILALPEGRRDSRLAAAAERSTLPAGTEPVINPYTFDLPEATPATRAAAANASEGRLGLGEIDNAINDLNMKYEQRVIDEYKYLKESRDSRRGVQQGSLQRDVTGDVVGRAGRISENPLWYQEFYRSNGRVPSNKDLYQLARERVDNGFMDEVGAVPSWKAENGFDEQLAGLVSARETLQNSLREIDPALHVTDQPIISKELRDTRIEPNSERRPTTAPYQPEQPGTAKMDPRRQEINDRLARGESLTPEDIDYILASEPRPNPVKIEPQVESPKFPEVDPNAEPILNPSQFEEHSGVGISPFSKTNPYDSLRTDTRSQLVSRQKREFKGLTANADKLYTALIDDLHPLNQQDKILENVMGEKLPSNQRIHDTGLASRGADVVAKRIITEGLVDAKGQVVGKSLKSILAPLKPLMKRNKHIYVDFEDYLLNKHAITRFERGEKVFRDELKWTPDYGAQKVSEYERMFPEFKEMSEGLYEFQGQVAQKWLVDTGMIPQDMLDAWIEKNPFYVPNKRYFSELEKTGKGFGGKKRGYGNQSNPVKAYQKGGSQRLIISPIEAMIENVDAFVKSAKRNKVMQQYVKNIERAPDEFEPWAEIVKQPERAEDIAKIVLDEGGLEELLFRFSADFDAAMQRTQLDKDNIVRALVDGNPVHVQIKDKQLLSALTALGPEQTGKILQGIGKLTNTMKLLTTGSNPVFSLTRNLFRDIPQAYIASKTRDNPFIFMAELASAAIDIGMKRGAYKDFLNIGGGHASAIAADRNLLQQSKNAVLPASGGTRLHRGLRDGYENLLNAVEAAPRLSEFKRVRALGGDLQAALMAAQDLTVNFKRRGALSGEADKIFPYFNAAIQGIDKTVRTYRDDPAKALVKSILAITIPTLALYAINRDDPNYQKLSNRTKDAFMLIPRGDGKFIKISKPQEQGTIFSDIPERLLRMFAEQDPAAFRDFADRIRTTLIPPGVSGLTSDKGPLAGVFGDTILGPGVDVLANESWSGAPIVPGHLQKLSPGLQADANTTWPARKIGEMVHGTPLESSFTSPKNLDYLAKQYTGWIGQFGQPLLSSGGDAGYALSQLMTADPVFSNDLSTEFYHYKEKVDQAYNDRELKQLPEWYNDPLRKRLNKISQNMSSVRKQMRDVQNDQSLSNKDKRERLRALQERINEMAEAGNSLAREIVPY